MRRIAFLLTAFLVTCAPVPVTSTPPPADGHASVVTLAAERLDADRVRLILQNGYSGAVGYNLCTSGLQKRNGSAWDQVETGDICTMELRSLPPGQDATFEKRLPENLPSGEYRYSTSVEIPMRNAQVRVATDAFAVK